MKTIFVEATPGTPRVEFNPNGDMMIVGRSLPEDPFTFYDPLINWAKEYTGSSIQLDLRLDYMNTSSSKQIYNLLFSIAHNAHINTTKINWYYEEGDDDAFETGKEFESMLKIPFFFHEHAEILD